MATGAAVPAVLGGVRLGRGTAVPGRAGDDPDETRLRRRLLTTRPLSAPITTRAMTTARMTVSITPPVSATA